VLQPLDPQDGAPARHPRSINALNVLLAYGEPRPLSPAVAGSFFAP
jgi:hypothetical protein